MMIDETALKEVWNKEVIRGRTANGQLPFFEVWEEIGSTNDRAAVLAKGGAPDFCLVTADKQTAGKGRRGRVWESPAGSSLSMSLILRPRVPLDTLSQLTILGGIAVKRCLEKAGTAPRRRSSGSFRPTTASESKASRSRISATRIRLRCHTPSFPQSRRSSGASS